jgi:hypothetical protein
MRPPQDRTAAERTGILVVRVWLEPGTPDRLRARLTQAADLGDPATPLDVATGVPGICDAVEAWLRRFLDSPER